MSMLPASAEAFWSYGRKLCGRVRLHGSAAKYTSGMVVCTVDVGGFQQSIRSSEWELQTGFGLG